jgi:hypothetical protein
VEVQPFFGALGRGERDTEMSLLVGVAFGAAVTLLILSISSSRNHSRVQDLVDEVVRRNEEVRALQEALKRVKETTDES